jgi:hypothetical protein
VLELLRIVEALKGNPRRVFADILRRRAEPEVAVSSSRLFAYIAPPMGDAFAWVGVGGFLQLGC